MLTSPHILILKEGEGGMTEENELREDCLKRVLVVSRRIEYRANDSYILCQETRRRKVV